MTFDELSKINDEIKSLETKLMHLTRVVKTLKSIRMSRSKENYINRNELSREFGTSHVDKEAYDSFIANFIEFAGDICRVSELAYEAKIRKSEPRYVYLRPNLMPIYLSQVISSICYVVP